MRKTLILGIPMFVLLEATLLWAAPAPPINFAVVSPDCMGSSLNPTSNLSVPSTQTDAAINLAAGTPSCAWTATSDNPWLTIQGTANGTGSATISYRALANTTSTSRSGSIFLQGPGKTFHVTQAASTVVDTYPPTNVQLLYPISGNTLKSIETLRASAQDNIGIAKIEFYGYNLAGWELIGMATASPFNLATNTAELTNGPNAIYCEAYDAAGNSGRSAPASITVKNSVAGDLAWIRVMPQTLPGGFAYPQAVRVDHHGNAVVVGYFAGTINFGCGPLATLGGHDVFIAKYDASGTCLWARNRGGTDDQVATSIAVDRADNLIVSGYFQGTPDLGGGSMANPFGIRHSFVAKYDLSGNHLWSKAFYGGSCYVAVDGSDNIAVAGIYTVDTNLGGVPLKAFGSGDIFVAKFSSAGGPIWAKGFGSNEAADLAKSVAVDSSGNVLIAGTTYGQSINLGNGTLASNGNPAAVVAKYASLTGGHMWSKTIGASAYGSGIVVDNSDKVVLVGAYNGSINFGGGVLGSLPKPAFYIAKYSAGGAYDWARSFGGNSDSGETGNGVAVDASGNIAVIGTASGSVDFGRGITTAATGNGDAFVAKYSPSGGYLWANRATIDNVTRMSGDGITMDVDGNVFATGTFNGTANFGGGDTFGLGAPAGYLVKYKYGP